MAIGELDGQETGTADLADAIEELRSTLERAWERGRRRRVRFRPEPVELTVRVALTRGAKGAAGLRWQILTLNGERSRQAERTHALTIRLTPVITDASVDEQLIQDVSGSPSTAARAS